jgi:hypothetical protein
MKRIDLTSIARLAATALERTVFVFAEPSEVPPSGRLWGATISFSGEAEGHVAIIASDGFIRQVAAGFASIAPAKIDLSVYGQDAMNELANVVGGMIVAELSGATRRIRIGLPKPFDPSKAAEPGEIRCFCDSMGDAFEIRYKGDGVVAQAA